MDLENDEDISVGIFKVNKDGVIERDPLKDDMEIK